jgi:uncharacterized protein
MREFAAVDQALISSVDRAVQGGLSGEISPILKTGAELDHGSPLILDMVEEAVILYDPQLKMRQLIGAWRTRI